MNTRDNQRGGIVVFAVVGVLLAGLLAGALYVGRQQSEVAKAPTPIAIDTEKEATETGKGVESAPKGEEQDKPASTPGTTQQPRPSAPATTPGSSAQTGPRVSSVATTGPSEPLPSTGPADTLLGMGVIMAVSFVGLAFVQSNHRLRRSALNR